MSTCPCEGGFCTAANCDWEEGSTVIGPIVNGTQVSVTLVDWSAPATKLYRTGLFDPPWPENGGGKVKRGADRHYPTMKVRDICALPIGQLFEPDAHFYMWATNNYLEAAFDVIKAWGFKFITCITWGKMGDKGIQEGLGQYFRGSSEQLLFCKRGSIPYQKTAAGKRAQGRTLYLAPRTAVHSEKPEVFRQIIERVSPGPYLEGFARRAAPGWDLWGNQAPDSIDLPGVAQVSGQPPEEAELIPPTEENADAEENA